MNQDETITAGGLSVDELRERVDCNVYSAFRRNDPHSLGTRLAFAAFNRPFGVPSQWALCS